MAKRKLAVDVVMDEQPLWYGGEQRSRRQIQDELLAAGNDTAMVDWYLFCLAQHQPTVIVLPEKAEDQQWQRKQGRA